MKAYSEREQCRKVVNEDAGTMFIAYEENGVFYEEYYERFNGKWFASWGRERISEELFEEYPA